MISSVFNFIKAALSLTELVVTNLTTKFNESKPTIQAKLDEASQRMKDRCGTN